MMKYWKVEIECGSPVHIGSGDTYTKSQYVYDVNAERVSLVNEKRWAFFLEEKGLTDSFVQELIRSGKHFSLYEWLRNQPGLSGRGSMRTLFSKLRDQKILSEAIPVEAEGKQAINDINAFIRDAEGHCYIPGSSIKGAFRTAILTKYILDHKSEYQREWSQIEKEGLQRGKTLSDLETRLTQPERNAEGGKAGLTDSYFRGLQVSDAVISETNPVITKKLDLNISDARTGRDPHGVALFRECLDAPTKAEFTVGIDGSPNRMGALGIYTMDDMLKACRSFMDLQYRILAPLFKTRDYPKEVEDLKSYDLLLGGGTGFLSKTLVYALAPDAEKGARVVKKLWPETKSIYSRHHHSRDRELSPHTLKLTDVDGYFYLIGLCGLKILEEISC